MFTDMFENNRGHIAQRRLQIECEFSLLLQQLTALSGIGAVLNVIVVVQLNLFGATLAGVYGISEVVALVHQAIDVVQRF